MLFLPSEFLCWYDFVALAIADRFQTISLVLFPGLAPAVATGFVLAFARVVSQYGYAIFIAGNLLYISEIAPLLIVIRFEKYDYAAANTVTTIMLALWFLMLLVMNFIQSRTRKRYS